MSSNQYPLISVLVPVYNCESYISECIDSILKQDYPNFEIIIYNDGSTDRSLSICNDYALKNKNIKVYSDTNKGVAIARNKLLDKIGGEYFLFVDADDWIEPQTLSFLYDTLQKYNCDISTCAVKTNINQRIDIKTEIWNKGTTIKEFLKHKRLNGSLWNKLIKTDLLGETRFKEGVYYGEDALFTWNIIKNIKQIVVTNNPLYNYRPNPNSLSRQNWTADRKGTGYIVWREICKDVEANYNQFLDIAISRCALEDMWALFFASISNWPKDESIILRQKFIKDHHEQLSEFRLDGNAAYYTALILSRYYEAGKIINGIKTILRKIR